jgi:hypothetical protein
MTHTHKFLIGLFLSVIILIGIGTAAPAMVNVWPLTCSTATFNANGGAAGDAWFQWGQHSGAGTFSDSQYGPPMLTGTTYYVIPCDTTGCGAELGFFVPNATRINQTSFGTGVITMMRRGFNITEASALVIRPFTAPYPSAVANAIPYGLIFFFIFTGMWIRQRDMLIPMMIAMCSGGIVWLGGSALGVPPEFITLGQIFTVIGFAGTFYKLFSK